LQLVNQGFPSIVRWTTKKVDSRNHTQKLCTSQRVHNFWVQKN
jgi:hypothetical protein